MVKSYIFRAESLRETLGAFPRYKGWQRLRGLADEQVLKPTETAA